MPALDALMAEAAAGGSQAMVLRGEAGIGKSALLAHASRQATDWHVARATGVESEMELAYSSLHQRRHRNPLRPLRKVGHRIRQSTRSASKRAHAHW